MVFLIILITSDSVLPVKNLISSNEKYYELGNIILDPNLGRKDKEDITVCDLTGTGVQDTAIARQTYEIAMNLKLGTKIE